MPTRTVHDLARPLSDAEAAANWRAYAAATRISEFIAVVVLYASAVVVAALVVFLVFDWGRS